MVDRSQHVRYMFLMTLDRKTWARNMEALDRDIDKQRERERKTRERSARRAQRKIARLHQELGEAGELNDFELTFVESVAERIEQYGSAFANPSLGRPSDALSSAQKRVVAAMKKKAKAAKKAALASPEPSHTEQSTEESPAPSPLRPRLVQ